MNNNTISIKNLFKVYRLYAKPQHRLLDMLGLLQPNKYTEYAAINDLTLSIKKGEKVGIIGRNGAGKSTLLKLISGVIEPTSGNIAVNGNARALLQIGTGFHYDFTGRENVKAYLAQQGVTHNVDELIADIIDFSELEDYIDQPLKTYSTGMAARLMFATSTVISPDLLILDEVLSVGDAYFTQKCFDRITEMADHNETTLLIVSHDIYSAAKICDRMIWIDKGRILIDSLPDETLKAYEESVRLQEELRLRKKALMNAKKSQNATLQSDVLIIEISAVGNKPLLAPLYFSKIALYESENLVSEINLASHKQNTSTSHVVFEGGCWSNPEVVGGKQCRAMSNWGSPYHKVCCNFIIPNLESKLTEGNLNIRLEYYSKHDASVHLNLFYNLKPLCSQLLLITANKWSHYVLPIHRALLMQSFQETIIASGQHGTGEIRLTNVKIVNAHDEFTRILEHGKEMKILLDYEIVKPDLCEKIDIIFAFVRDGVETAGRITTNNLLFDATRMRTGRLLLNIQDNQLGVGEYALTVLFAKPGYIAKENHKFFAVNPDIYVFIRELCTFKVVGKGIVVNGTPYVARGNWKLLARETESCKVTNTEEVS